MLINISYTIRKNGFFLTTETVLSEDTCIMDVIKMQCAIKP